METITFKGMLSPEEAITLAQKQLKVHNHLSHNLPFNNLPDLGNIEGFKMVEHDDDHAKWLPVLKCTFNWSRKIENENLYYILSIKPMEQFISELSEFRAEQTKKARIK